MEVINDPGLAGLWGHSIGQGLQILAQHKISQMNGQKVKSQTFHALKALGAPDEEASAMANMPEKLQEKMFPNYVNSLLEQRRSNPGEMPQQQSQQPQQEQPQNSLAALQGLSAAAPSQEAAVGQPQANIASAPRIKFPTAQENAQKFTQQLGIGKGQEAINQIGQEQQQPQTQSEPQNPLQQATQQITNETRQPRQKPEGWKPYTFKQQAELRKENKKFVDELFHKAEGAKTTKMTIGRMEVINREGKLIDPTSYAVLKKHGWDIAGLMTADTNEFKKLEQVFLQHMKDIFGSRIAISEMEQFIQGIPSLMQTPEGRERVFRNFRIMADLDEDRLKVFKDIEKQYGYQPENLRSVFDTKMEPIYEQKIKEFSEGAQRPAFKAGDKIDISKIPAFTVPGMMALKNGKKYRSDGAQWVEKD